MRKKWIWLLAGVLLLGGFFRFFHLGTIFFNNDEPFNQVRISYQPLAFVLTYNNGPLFSILVHFLLPLGRLEIMARLISFVSGFLVVILTFILGRTMFSRTIGLIAALFVACNHLLIYYSQQSRIYALLSFLFLLSFTFLYKAVRDGKRRDWILYGVTLCLYLYNHTIAFLILPTYAMFVGYAWLDGQFMKTKGAAHPLRPRTIRRFVLWTAGAVGVALLLYMPCAWMTDMFFGSLRRGVGASSDAARLTLTGIVNTLYLQISPTNLLFFVLTMGLFVIGLAVRFPAYRREMVLVLGTVAFPWLVFVLGKPRANDLFSLYRYIQYFLPLIFLLAARGIEALASGAARLAARRSPRRRVFIAGAVMTAFAAVLAWGYVSNLGGYYYSDYWRGGSWSFDRDVRTLLAENAERDAVLFVDDYPVSSRLLLLNPLSRDLRPEEVVRMARENYVRPAGARQIMISIRDWGYFSDYVASSRIELWAVTRKTPEKSAVWRSALGNRTDIDFMDLETCSVLHFKKDAQTVAGKMAVLADLLLAAPDGDSVTREQRLLFAVNAFLMTRSVQDGLRELRALDGITVDSRTEAAHAGSLIERGLGRLLGWDPLKLRAAYKQRTLSTIGFSFLSAGIISSDAGRLDDAALAYEGVLRAGRDFYGPLLGRLVELGDRFEKSGRDDGALKAWKTASRLDRKRQDVQARIARVRARSGANK